MEEYKLVDEGVKAPVQSLDQELKNAPNLDYDVSGEHWVRIDVGDGADLRFKAIVVGVKRISDDPKSGEPRYFVKTQNILRVARRADDKAIEHDPSYPGSFKLRTKEANGQ